MSTSFGGDSISYAPVPCRRWLSAQPRIEAGNRIRPGLTRAYSICCCILLWFGKVHTAQLRALRVRKRRMETQTDISAAEDAADRVGPLTGPSRERAIVTIGLMLGMLITAMEGTVVSTAMPTIIGSLHGIQLYAWVFSAYLVTSTTTVPIYGKLADALGRRPVFLGAAALFLLGSILSGAAHSMPQLIAFRALQGLGAGGVLPVTLTIIGDLYNLRERARVQVVFTSMWGTASLAGPQIGAFLTTHLSWRAVFYVNVPIGLVSVALVGALLQEGARRRTSKVRLDLLGTLLLTGSVVALLVLLLRLGEGEAWTLPSNLLLLIATVGGACGFVWQERRAEDPMLPLGLFAHPIILSSVFGNLLIGVMLYAMDTYMPLFMQGVRGGTAQSASLVLTPLLLCWALSAYGGGKALVRWNFPVVAMFGTGCIVTAALALAFTGVTTPTPQIITTMALLGMGLGPSSMAYLVSAQNAVAWNQRGVVTAISQFFRTIGGALGVGALGAVLNARMTAGLSGAHLSPNALLNAQVRSTLSESALDQARMALESGLHLVFVLLAIGALAACFGIVTILRKATEETTEAVAASVEAEWTEPEPTTEASPATAPLQ